MKAVEPPGMSKITPSFKVSLRLLPVLPPKNRSASAINNFNLHSQTKI